MVTLFAIMSVLCSRRVLPVVLVQIAVGFTGYWAAQVFIMLLLK